MHLVHDAHLLCAFTFSDSPFQEVLAPVDEAGEFEIGCWGFKSL